MIDIDSIFLYKKMNKEKLMASGFAAINDAFQRKIPVMRKQFELDVTISNEEQISFRVIEKALLNIAATCFDTEILKAEQTKRTLTFICDTYGVQPEFLWEKTPDCAAFRRPDNEKWFIVCLDGSLPDEELWKLLQESYESAGGKKTDR